MALPKLVRHVVPASMYDVGSMVEMVAEMHHDYCQRTRMEKEQVRCSCPFGVIISFYFGKLTY
jgi:hypothetical protein